jgi:heme/copper-type cytochrome/quinol oxidase subunit 1
MSSFKHYSSNKHRYNIYESHIQEIEAKNFYMTLRNTLFFTALILSLFVTSLISIDNYNKERNKNTQQRPIKDEITKNKLIKAISNNIFQKISRDNSLKDINQHQLKRIIKNVMEKIENSPNQIIYTQK